MHFCTVLTSLVVAIVVVVVVVVVVDHGEPRRPES